MSRRDMCWTLAFWVSLVAVALVATVVLGCVAAARTGDGDRTVNVEPPPPFVGPPAPIEIDQDSLAGQIVAKLEARLQVMLSAVANVASGNTTYYGWGAAGLAALAWIIQARSTRLQYLLAKSLADQLDKRATESHERAARRIECEFSRVSTRRCTASEMSPGVPGVSPAPAPGDATVEVR
ncbi:MAG: hypothetical protein IT450_17950 [Phycisphaerales bacterium]|nr:hypothetical protein [Phycisphaerales bacterium]